MKRRSKASFKHPHSFFGKFSSLLGGLATVRKYATGLALLVTGFALGTLMLAFLLAGDIYDYKDTALKDSLPPVDAIVCLAGGRGRISAAGDLWYQYLDRVLEVTSDSQTPIPILYFSGLGHQANWSLLTRQLSKRVLQVVQPEDVVIENESANTDENAKWLLRIAQQRHWKRIVLLTSSYHMKRANFIFSHVLKAGGVSLQMDTLSVTQEPFSSKQWRSGLWGIRVTLQEYLKWVYYKSIWASN
ncbi:MAG: YdcF family protein [Bdellovibrionia bacterium]